MTASDDRIARMLTHMRAFQAMRGRWDEGEKGRDYARFKAAWDEATTPERQAYQTAIFGEVRERHERRQAAPRTPAIDLAAHRQRRAAERSHR